MISVLSGIGWHVVGASMAASFYAPIERVRKWSWETTWAVAGLFSWVLLPISVSFVLLPNFHSFYGALGTSLLLKVALFGAMWGVGNVSYGLTMRHLGISLGIGVAIGVTLVVGTLVPPLVHGQAAMLFKSRSGLITLSGVVVALIGVAIVSWAGHQKEVQLKGDLVEFNVGLGLLLAVMCRFSCETGGETEGGRRRELFTRERANLRDWNRNAAQAVSGQGGISKAMGFEAMLAGEAGKVVLD